MNEPLAELQQVHKSYGSRDGLSEVSLQFWPGQAVGLLGLNGAGKTTLIKLLAGMLQPSRGQVRVAGQPARWARHRIAYLPDSETYDWLTPADGQRLMAGLYPDFRPQQYQKLLEILEVPQRPSRQQSRGQRARLRLAMALAREASLFLLDEPLAGIDLISRERILQALIQEWRQEATLVLSTHEVVEAEGLFERVIFLRQGTVALDTLAETLRAEGRSVAQTFKEVLA